MVEVLDNSDEQSKGWQHINHRKNSYVLSHGRSDKTPVIDVMFVWPDKSCFCLVKWKVKWNPQEVPLAVYLKLHQWHNKHEEEGSLLRSE